MISKQTWDGGSALCQAWSPITSMLLKEKQDHAGQVPDQPCLATSYEPSIRAGISWRERTSEIAIGQFEVFTQHE